MITGNKVAFYVLILVAGACCWLFLDQIIQYITENFVEAIGVGGASAAVLAEKRRRSKKRVEESAKVREEEKQQAGQAQDRSSEIQDDIHLAEAALIDDEDKETTEPNRTRRSLIID